MRFSLQLAFLSITSVAAHQAVTSQTTADKKLNTGSDAPVDKNLMRMETPPYEHAVLIESHGTFSHVEGSKGNHQQESTEAVDCSWNDWSAWSACTAGCGGGDREATRTREATAANGGKECEGPHEKTENCNTEECACHADGQRASSRSTGNAAIVDKNVESPDGKGITGFQTMLENGDIVWTNSMAEMAFGDLGKAFDGLTGDWAKTWHGACMTVNWNDTSLPMIYSFNEKELQSDADTVLKPRSECLCSVKVWQVPGNNHHAGNVEVFYFENDGWVPVKNPSAPGFTTFYDNDTSYNEELMITFAAVTTSKMKLDIRQHEPSPWPLTEESGCVGLGEIEFIRCAPNGVASDAGVVKHVTPAGEKRPKTLLDKVKNVFTLQGKEGEEVKKNKLYIAIGGGVFLLLIIIGVVAYMRREKQLNDGGGGFIEEDDGGDVWGAGVEYDD